MLCYVVTRGSSVSVVTRLRAGRPGIRIRFPTGAMDLSVLGIVKPGSRTN
jgi:hypothetical protein